MIEENEQTDLLKQAVDLAFKGELGAVLNRKQLNELQILIRNASRAKAQLDGVAHGLNGHSLESLLTEDPAPTPTTSTVADSSEQSTKPGAKTSAKAASKSKGGTKKRATSSKKQKLSGKPAQRWELLSQEDFAAYCDAHETWAELAKRFKVSPTTVTNWAKRGTVPTMKHQRVLAKAVADHKAAA